MNTPETKPVPSPTTTTTTTDAGNDTLYIIVGAAAFGGVFALVALSVLACRRRSLSSTAAGAAVTTAANSASATLPEQEGALRRRTHNHHLTSNGGGGGVGKGGTTTFGVSSEIVLGDKDEVSTLGDPVLQQTGMVLTGVTDPDEQTASVENDYDFKKQFLKSQGVGSLESLERISSDNSISIQYSSAAALAAGYDSGGGADDPGGDGSQPIRFEVSVPPGKLGMVIDTPNGGVPCVHAIKSDSILAPYIQVGDRLVLVDGDDVTIMSAMQVSQLISFKSDQNRVLVFVRHPKPQKNQQQQQRRGGDKDDEGDEEMPRSAKT
ncbi:hypothetical protein ACA910_022195 [Epithemia clementina (nom. ined.)]